MSISHKGVVRRKDADIEGYRLPRWDRSGNLVESAKKPEKTTEVEDVEVEDVQMPTLADVEAIRESAYNEGFEQGFEGGMKEGRRVGEQKGHQQGQEQGYQDGLQKGRDEGLAQALKEEQTKTDQKLSVLDAAGEALKQQLSQEQDELKDALLALSVRIARQVIQDELRLEKEHIASVVHASVQSLPNPDEKLTLQIHPDDYDVVSRFADSHWQIETTDTVSPGGCIVKSGYSLIDYTLEHRFANAVTHFLSELAPAANAEQLSTPLSDHTLMPEPSSAAEEPGHPESVDPAAAEADSPAQPETSAGAAAIGESESGEHDSSENADSERSDSSDTQSVPDIDDGDDSITSKTTASDAGPDGSPLTDEPTVSPDQSTDEAKPDEPDPAQ